MNSCDLEDWEWQRFITKITSSVDNMVRAMRKKNYGIKYWAKNDGAIVYLLGEVIFVEKVKLAGEG